MCLNSCDGDVGLADLKESTKETYLVRFVTFFALASENLFSLFLLSIQVSIALIPQRSVYSHLVRLLDLPS